MPRKTATHKPRKKKPTATFTPPVRKKISTLKLKPQTHSLLGEFKPAEDCALSGAERFQNEHERIVRCLDDAISGIVRSFRAAVFPGSVHTQAAYRGICTTIQSLLRQLVSIDVLPVGVDTSVGLYTTNGVDHPYPHVQLSDGMQLHLWGRIIAKPEAGTHTVVYAANPPAALKTQREADHDRLAEEIVKACEAIGKTYVGTEISGSAPRNLCNEVENKLDEYKESGALPLSMDIIVGLLVPASNVTMNVVTIWPSDDLQKWLWGEVRIAYQPGVNRVLVNRSLATAHKQITDHFTPMFRGPAPGPSTPPRLTRRERGHIEVARCNLAWIKRMLSDVQYNCGGANFPLPVETREAVTVMGNFVDKALEPLYDAVHRDNLIQE